MIVFFNALEGPLVSPRDWILFISFSFSFFVGHAFKAGGEQKRSVEYVQTKKIKYLGQKKLYFYGMNFVFQRIKDIWASASIYLDVATAFKYDI
jgi:hypothetical protein